MNNFFIITNISKDPDFKMTYQIADYLKTKGKKCGYTSCMFDSDSLEYKYINPREIPKDVEGLIVLGGDGTLLQVSRDTLPRQIPLVGMNMGNLGYLAEISREAVFDALDAMINDNYKIESRMMLQGTIYRDGKELLSDLALNDIFMNKAVNKKMIQVNNYIDGAHLNSYFADGIIVSSPTGSTGYSLSAGGPIVSPNASLFVITPIAPHTLINRSVIVPSDETIWVELGKNKYGFDCEAEVFFDGNSTTVIRSGDRIEITRSKIDVKMIKIYESSFMDVLSKKMN